MVHNNLIKNIAIAAQMICKKEKGEKFSPALILAASLDCGEGGVGGSRLRFYLWVEISTCLWMCKGI